MHSFLIGHYYRSPIGDIVRCIGSSATEVVWQTKDLLFYISSYREGMKYQYLPDCDSFDLEEFPQWYILENKDWFMNPWALKRTSRDVATRYELTNDGLTHEEQAWYHKADCWALVTEQEALACVSPAYPSKESKRIRTNLWFDKDDGVVIQADKMPDDRFTQLQFDAEGVYYLDSGESRRS